MSKLLFIEGCDGTGKTSVGKAMVELYKQLGKRALWLPIIEGCYTGAEYRKQYLEGHLEGYPSLEALGMLYSVNTTLTKVVEPSLLDNDLIVVDRSLASFYTYQIQTNRYTWMLEAFEQVLSSTPEGKTLYLTVDPQAALDRILAKRGSLDTVEARGPEYQRRIAASYEECFRMCPLLAPDLRLAVDTMGSPESIALVAAEQLYGDVVTLV